ncbi:DEAD/DEAH box helicase, partial [Thermoproteota archaeon]
PNNIVQAIILTPTRELALQVSNEINSLKGNRRLTVIPVYGGAPIGPQRTALKHGVDIVVGTPGRVMDLQRRNSLRLNNIKYAVLDEADEMLNMGFVEDIETILKHTPKDKSMLLFSATIPKPILRIAQRYMREYEFIAVEKENIIISTVEQTYYDINARDRVEGLKRIIDFNIDFHGIIFCNTRSEVDILTQKLTKMHYSAAGLHGDITQSQREKILVQFRNKHVKILVATDVAARGIDVDNLTHVINYALPRSADSYVHRIGRTGRAGKLGKSITFVIPSEKRQLSFVEKVNNCKIVRQELPSPKDIVENKEAQIKNVIEEIIKSNSSISSKYNELAEELLKTNPPKDIITAILNYSFKNKLNSSEYKDLSKLTKAKHSDDRPRRRSGKPRHKNRHSNDRSGNRHGKSDKRKFSNGRKFKKSDKSKHKKHKKRQR